MRNPFCDLTRFERALYVVSLILVTGSFLLSFPRDYLSWIASLIGVTALIFVAKGYVIGQILTAVFALIYGIVSYDLHYYGEMITYLGMTLPISVFALISWLRNPFKDNKAEVKVNSISKKETIFMLICAVAVTVLFYFILKYFNTANILPSTLSVTTSFIAVYLTFRRSPLFALAYASNDIVLIVLWIMASIYDTRYISVVICFVSFMVNDVYGYISWQKMKIRQNNEL